MSTAAVAAYHDDPYRFVLNNSHVTYRASSLHWQLLDARDDRPCIAVPVPALLRYRDYVAGDDPALGVIH